MAADVTLLTTRAECDVALAALTKEKAAYTHHNDDQAYRDGVATDQATTRAAKLAKAIDDVTRYTADVARPGLTPTERRSAQRSLISATARRDNLQLSTSATAGPDAYLSEVNDDQVDGQIIVLDKAIADVTAHKATLTA